MTRDDHQRMAAFVQSERPSLDTFFNSVSTYFVVKKERDIVVEGLYAATSSKERREVIERWNKEEFAKMGEREKVECGAHLDRQVGKNSDKKISDAQAEFLVEDWSAFVNYTHRNLDRFGKGGVINSQARAQENDKHQS